MKAAFMHSPPTSVQIIASLLARPKSETGMDQVSRMPYRIILGIGGFSAEEAEHVNRNQMQVPNE